MAAVATSELLLLIFYLGQFFPDAPARVGQPERHEFLDAWPVYHFILRGLLHHLPERALAVLKNLAAQRLRIGVELVCAETVRGVCASAWPFLGRARVGFSIRTPHAISGITELSGDPGRAVICETSSLAIWRPVGAVIADSVRGCEFPRAFPFP